MNASRKPGSRSGRSSGTPKSPGGKTRSSSKKDRKTTSSGPARSSGKTVVRRYGSESKEEKATQSPNAARTGRTASPRSERSNTHGRRTTRKKDREEVIASLKRTKSVFDKTAVRDENDDFRGHRLQKVLAAAGFGSRRQCEELITTGRVEIDGKTVTQLGTRVFPVSQKIRVDGELLHSMKPVYMVVNKPRGVLCTNRDQQGRERAIDLIPPSYGRLFPVGRLDRDSEGLLLMTNDGNLAIRLTHPRYEVPKKYRVQVAGLVEPELIRDLKKGIHLAEAVVQADEVVLKSRHKLSSILEITLKEGKNREIRRMLARIGHKVMHLQRIAIGPIKLGKMLPGQYRPLTSREVSQLYKVAELVQLEKQKDQANQTGKVQ